ncbi:hypothetical protein Ae168Ps1_6110c [Pseudonocardia sp. Ae168_Ps1]|nr:hypothetical protein Ae150APs1_6045c [Pseudonocardia sp. Ae150A_Ps1]OLL70645.1 hypothetical protein Ae168Ps1_6110c [Pseudonocardia sp. Ae168_Ps1]
MDDAIIALQAIAAALIEPDLVEIWMLIPESRRRSRTVTHSNRRYDYFSTSARGETLDKLVNIPRVREFRH